MTNPDNALGTNGAFGGRTSVNAFNDVLATFASAGIVSGFAVAPDTGMTVNVGGSGTVRDVAVAEDPFGNRTTVDNISGDPIPVTIDTASTTTARIDSIVAYVNSPANASDTSVDNPTACGIISVNGTSGGAPLDSAIRTAITADGGTGSTAYYVVIANVSVPANTTTITSGLISTGTSINLSNAVTTGSNGLMLAADKTKLNSLYPNTYSSSEVIVGTWKGKPLYRKIIEYSGTMSAVIDVQHGISNFGMLVSYCGYAISAGSSKPIPVIYSANQSTYGISLYSATNSIVTFALGSWAASNTTEIVAAIEYTKTSD